MHLLLFGIFVTVLKYHVEAESYLSAKIILKAAQ